MWFDYVLKLTLLSVGVAWGVSFSVFLTTVVARVACWWGSALTRVTLCLVSSWVSVVIRLCFVVPRGTLSASLSRTWFRLLRVLRWIRLISMSTIG